MSNLSPTIRKAAILVSTLDELSADALLAQMGAETAARVRSALVELDDVSPQEQQRVLAEFFRGERSSPAAGEARDDGGVELDISLAPRADDPLPARPGPVHALRAFDFLYEVPPGETVRVLARESAQTAAVIIARLDARLAAQLLEYLPPDLATQVLERMASLEEPAPDVLADIEGQLRLELAPFQLQGNRPQSLAGLQALVGAMGTRVRERVLASLGKRNANLARQLGYEGDHHEGTHKVTHQVTATRYRIETDRRVSAGRQPVPLIEFEDLLALSNEALRRIFAAADPQVVLLALTGAPESLVARMVGQLPPGEAATLRKRLNHPGAVRLSDIEAAQEQLTAVARRLAEEGAIVLPGSRHFAAAA